MTGAIKVEKMENKVCSAIRIWFLFFKTLNVKAIGKYDCRF